jgi:hypothetical protein
MKNVKDTVVKFGSVKKQRYNIFAKHPYYPDKKG